MPRACVRNPGPIGLLWRVGYFGGGGGGGGFSSNARAQRRRRRLAVTRALGERVHGSARNFGSVGFNGFAGKNVLGAGN